jgi:ABC-2 type transport system ATP-binding protein
VIELDKVSYRYRPDRAAVDDVSLSIAPGECFGLIGSNGAGKTTTIRMLSTLLVPASGTIRIDGHDAVADYRKVRRALGYMPESVAVYPELTVEEFLHYTAAAYAVPVSERQRRVDAVVGLLDLDAKRSDGCGTLSRGVQQRLFLARALVHDPPVLLLDEPTGGLDPAARIEFRQIMRALTASGKTIVVSSHILPEMSEFCTSVGIIDRGKLIAAGSIEAIRARYGGPVEIAIETGVEASSVAAVMRAQPHVLGVRTDGRRATINYGGRRDDLPGLLRALVEAGVPILSFGEHRSSLEEIFMKAAAFDVA